MTTKSKKDYFPPTSGGTSASSSSSSPSSSGGSSAPSGPSPDVVANAVASYTNMWASWGIPITPSLKQWVEQHIRAGAGSAEILALFRKTKAYAQRFPGILRNDGSMRLTEAQYLAGYASARDYAASVGRNLSPQAYGLAVKNGNSPSEIKAKLQAVDIVTENRDMFSSFSDYLVARGVIKKPLARKDMLAFTMRQGPAQWEQEWQTAYTAGQLENIAGVDVGKPKQGGEVSYKKLGNLINQAESFGIKPNLSVLAAQLNELPDAQLYDSGLTRQDVIAATFSPKKARAIEPRLTRAWATHVAFATEQRANPQLTQGPRGSQLMTGGAEAQQASE